MAETSGIRSQTNGSMMKGGKMIIWIITIYLIFGASLCWEAKDYRWMDRIVLAICWLPVLIYFFFIKALLKNNG